MKTLIFSFFAVFLMSCSSDDDSKNSYPICLQSAVDRILDVPAQSPPANIKLYLYQTKEVYVVNTYFPDDYSYVYSDCEMICTIGGIGGNQNDTCVDWESASYIETVWTDNR